MKTLWLGCFVALWPCAGKCERTSLNIGRGTISYSSPLGWARSGDEMGFDWLIKSPDSTLPRAVVGMKELTNTFNEEGIDSKGSWSDEDFQAGRKKWAASRFARVISFQKPSHEELSSGKKIHLVWTYEVAGTVYQEDSVFMSCGLQKIAVKGLTAASLSDAKKKAVREIMASVRCE